MDLQPLISGRLKNKKQPAQPVFLAANLNPNSRPVLSPCGRELERGQQAARLVFGRLSCWERLPQLGECPLPGPPPRGRERIAADFAVAGGLKSNLDLPLISGRMKNKKQPAQAVLVCINLNPNSRTVLSPCGRELERGQQAARLVF
ncbi:hypothetical protein LFI47_002156 [Neisseria gonorrhoeae]